VIVFEPAASPWWKDLLLAVPGVVTALAAVVGVRIAGAGLNTWRRETIGKRKAELAEAVLADFYEARDIISAARSPGGFADEGRTRQRAENETEDDSRNLDSYFRTIERLNNKNEFFAQLHSSRYRFQAIFGKSSGVPFDEVFNIRNEVIIAGRMLMMYDNAGDIGTLPQNRPVWLAALGWDPTNDPITPRLDASVEAVEKTCRPAIAESAE